MDDCLYYLTMTATAWVFLWWGAGQLFAPTDIMTLEGNATEKQIDHAVLKVWETYQKFRPRHGADYAQYLSLERAYCKQHPALCASLRYHTGRVQVCRNNPLKCKDPSEWIPAS